MVAVRDLEIKINTLLWKLFCIFENTWIMVITNSASKSTGPKEKYKTGAEPTWTSIKLEVESGAMTD